MTVVIDGTLGVRSVNGSAAAPSVTGTDTDTGIVYGTNTLSLATGGTTAVTVDSSQNVGIGTDSPNKSSVTKALTIDTPLAGNFNAVELANGGTLNFSVATNNTATYLGTKTSIPLVFSTADTERMRIDTSGNLLVGTTGQPTGTYRFVSSTNGTGASGGALFVSNQASTGNESFSAWHTATSGNNTFCYFGTEASFTSRGSITYNRGAGLVAYNVTSDYRAKDISGPVENSGELIDSVPVYMGKMKGATQERPMFIAHEVPAYAHTGEKDAVDAEGNPVYQQMDASALIPVMWAEIQSLRQRLASAGI